MAVAAEDLKRLIIVTGDRIPEEVVTAATQVVDVHVKNSFGLYKLLLLSQATGRVLLHITVFSRTHLSLARRVFLDKSASFCPIWRSLFVLHTYFKFV